MYKTREVCRACGFGKKAGPGGIKSAEETEELIPVFDLGIQPLANDFARPTDERAGYAPLKVLYCPRCRLGQLSVEVKPEILYARNYPYVTSNSKTMLDHFAKIESDLVGICESQTGVVEIGSNDGALLKFFGERGWKHLLGIDPAENLCKISIANGIPALSQFFDEYNALTARRSLGCAPALILARHCFCHVNDWQGFVRGLEKLAGEQTVIAIEVPYAQDMLVKCEFDTVYHEHTSYLSIQSIEYLLRDSSLCLEDVLEYDIHGGAIMLIIRSRKVAQVGKAILFHAKEKIDLAMWRKFAEHAEIKIMELGAMVRNLVSQGKKVVGYGASAKSTVWINACSFTKKEISFITDTTPGKWYTLSPGSDIPIVDSGALTRELPDYAILFAWNYAAECIEKEKIFRDKGGRWILPVPDIKIV